MCSAPTAGLKFITHVSSSLSVLATTAAPKGLSSSHIGIIVGVLVAVLLITVVVLFIIFRRRRASKKSLKKPTGTSEVYSDTTAPLDEESRVMLKSGER
ncbi:hypothetical protein EB796_021784 [Bugula neritina]|uniref:Uncharacterized protein n=1 Tax=Bugula neritina TaxID=10212 RepID=A0A7J7J2I7_BUGNE|nr:hypothetical protein EB796_021784 [Bugula neritina]